MNLDSETLRSLIVEYLRAMVKCRRAHELQWRSCFQAISHMVRERFPDYKSPFELMRDEDGARLKHVIWDMIIERILVPSTSNPGTINDGWPFFSLTEYGKQVIEEQRPLPYDPDGYLRALKADVTKLNGAVLEYLSEALGTFRTGNNLASAVMLGAASEMIFNELCEAIPPVMADQATREKLAEKLNRGKMKDRLNAIVGWCRNHKSHLPGTWGGDEQVEDIDKIADLIRRRRNEAGHPEDPPRRPTREQMYSYLMLFPEYCKHLYVLKEWALSNVNCIK